MGKGFAHNQCLVLDRHRERRGRGVPTLSVLVGDVEVARWCWTTWQRAAASPFACSGAATWEGALRDWLASSRHAALRDELSTQSARRAGPSPALASATASSDPDALIGWVLRDVPAALDELTRVVGHELPGLLVSPPRQATAPELCELLASLGRASDAAPRLELACALSEAQLVRFRQAAAPPELERVKQGLIRLEPAPEDPELCSPRARRRQRSGERAAASRESGDGMEALEYDAEEFARHRAERALFEHLETRPLTAGMFTPGACVPGGGDGRGAWGAAPLDVALLSEPLRVALEIDGDQDLRDPASYRRERDKDVRLQQLGYTVVRVLASDVTAELDDVVRMIERVVQHGRGERAGAARLSRG